MLAVGKLSKHTDFSRATCFIAVRVNLTGLHMAAPAQKFSHLNPHASLGLRSSRALAFFLFKKTLKTPPKNTCRTQRYHILTLQFPHTKMSWINHLPKMTLTIFFLTQGQVAYVLTQETDEYLLWNPLTGQCHKQFDPFCPLQSVDCLFDDGNVSIWGKKSYLELISSRVRQFSSTLALH